MRTTIKVPNIEDYYSIYPSIEMKKNRIIVRVCRYKFYRGQTFLEAGFIYAPYIPLTRIDISFYVTKNGIKENNDN